MGNSAAGELGDEVNSIEKADGETVESSEEPKTRKMRLLCMHGWRTSGDILKMQCAALKYHTQFEMVTINAPWAADGPPDPMIGQIYSNVPYYQWYYRHDEGDSIRFEGVQESINFIIDHIERTGPYDGLLGFSQGAAITTMVLSQLRTMSQFDAQKKTTLPRFAILIGGIQPMEQYFPKVSCLITTSDQILTLADWE